MRKLTILTPVYNDAGHLPQYLASVCGQTWPDWELIAINDGSSDATPEILNQAAAEDSRIRVLHQDNQGQQMAILNAVSHITGDVVMLAHSDDALTHPEALAQNMAYFTSPTVEGIYADFETMDGEGNHTQRLNYPEKLCMDNLPRLLAGRGSNPIPDHFFCRRDVFEQYVVPTYLHWNMPYWLVLDSKGRARRPLRLMKSPHPWYRYRLHGGNYHLSEVGRFVMSHGCMRTVLALGARYKPIRVGKTRRYVPLLSASRRQLWRLIAGVLKDYYGPAYVAALEGEPYQQSDLPVDALHPYHVALHGFYTASTHRHITLDVVPEAPWEGKDAVAFFKASQADDIPELYRYLISEARQGFSVVHVPDDEAVGRMRAALRFLNLNASLLVRRRRPSRLRARQGVA